MLMKPLLAWLITLTALSGAQTLSPRLETKALLNDSIQDGISIYLFKTLEFVGQQAQGPFLSIQLTGQVKGKAFQTWLLRTDGTAVPQRKPGQARLNLNGSDIMSVSFDDIPLKELAAVVVTVDGKTWVRAIKIE